MGWGTHDLWQASVLWASRVSVLLLLGLNVHCMQVAPAATQQSRLVQLVSDIGAAVQVGLLGGRARSRARYNGPAAVHGCSTLECQQTCACSGSRPAHGLACNAGRGALTDMLQFLC